MILGVGTDIIKVSRLHAWAYFSSAKLSRVFTLQELEDCCSGPCKQYFPEKLATRFAAKEAFYKAFSAMLVKQQKTEQKFSFLVTCLHVQVIKSMWDTPQLEVNWSFFERLVRTELHNIQIDLSFSHEKEYVVAFVVLSDE